MARYAAMFVVAALCIGAAPPTAAHAQIGFGLAAGASFPRGDFDKIANNGYHVTALASVRPPALPLGLRFEGTFSQYDHDHVIDPRGAQARILYATANAVLSAAGSSAPYLIGGVGVYHATSECSNCTASSTKGGINGGIGYRIGLTGFSAFVEARYHYIGGPSDPTNAGVPGSNTQFVPLSFGVVF